MKMMKKFKFKISEDIFIIIFYKRLYRNVDRNNDNVEITAG